MKIYCLLILLIVFSCSKKATNTGNISATTNPAKDNCPLVNAQTFMEISEGYNSKEVLDLAIKLEAAAKADAEAIKANANASAQFVSKFTDVIDKVSVRKTTVPVEYYQLYQGQRQRSCNLLAVMNDGKLTPAQYDRALNLYLEFQEEWESAIEVEKKKHQD